MDEEYLKQRLVEVSNFYNTVNKLTAEVCQHNGLEIEEYEEVVRLLQDQEEVIEEKFYQSFKSIMESPETVNRYLQLEEISQEAQELFLRQFDDVLFNTINSVLPKDDQLELPDNKNELN